MRISRLKSFPSRPERSQLVFAKDGPAVALAAATNSATSPTLVLLDRSVELEGPTSLFYTEVGSYEIKGYSDRKNYVVASTDGVVNRTGNMLSFVVTNTALASASFTINGRTITVAMKAIAVAAPTIVSPVDGTVGLSASSVTLVASPFSLNYAGATDTLVSADWEVATDPNFTNIVASSYNDTVNKTSFTVS